MVDFFKRLAQKNKILNYMVYLGFLIFGFLYKLLFVIFWIIPIKKNKIVFCSMKGKQIGDNPKYICNSIKKTEGMDIVWLLRKDFDFEIPAGARKVNYGLLSNAFQLATAAVWVDSNIKEYGVIKRPGQLFIQTWHGSYGLKRVGKDLEEKNTIIDSKLVPYNFKLADVMVSNSKKTTEIYRRAYEFKGKMIETGSPRNDIFFSSELKRECKKKVDQQYNIGNKNICLYAPTFRKSLGIEFASWDYSLIVSALEKRFGGEWIILLRLHPQNSVEAKKIASSEVLYNASYYPDMQELLVASDVLITDYSSCMFDFITVPRPVFIYAPDYSNYENERGYYFSMDELPFSCSKNCSELEHEIVDFDLEKYIDEVKKLHQKVGLNETGHASENVANYIIQYMEK